MARFPKIWFLRHGQTHWNLEGRIQGRLNSDLTELGLDQARAQARLMAQVLPEARAQGAKFYVSPLGRARQTAEIALEGQAMITDDRLAEINAGAWEGKLRREVSDLGDGLDAYTAAAGGEGFETLKARVGDFLGDLSGPAVIVSHGILGQVMRGVVCGLTRDGMAELSNLQGCIYVLENGRETLLQEV